MPAGRPRKFNTAEEMQAVIDDYLGAEDRPTVTGLALALNMTRQTLLQYEHDGEFSDTVKMAKARVEDALERALWDSNPAGKIFNLKNNFGWKDAKEQQITGAEGKPLSITFKGVPGAASD